MQKTWIFLALTVFSGSMAYAEDSAEKSVQIFSLPTTPSDEAPAVVPVEIVAQNSPDQVTVRAVGPFGNLHGEAIAAPALTDANGFGINTTWSVRLSSPQILSFSYGLLIGKKDMSLQGLYFRRGAIVQAELGPGGAKGSAGFAWRNDDATLQDIKGSFLYNWWLSPGITLSGDGLLGGDWKNQGSWAGIEYDHDYQGLKTSVGAMYKLSGDSNDGRYLLTFGIGFGGL